MKEESSLSLYVNNKRIDIKKIKLESSRNLRKIKIILYYTLISR